MSIFRQKLKFRRLDYSHIDIDAFYHVAAHLEREVDGYVKTNFTKRHIIVLTRNPEGVRAKLKTYTYTKDGTEDTIRYLEILPKSFKPY